MYACSPLRRSSRTNVNGSDERRNVVWWAPPMPWVAPLADRPAGQRVAGVATPTVPNESSPPFDALRRLLSHSPCIAHVHVEPRPRGRHDVGLSTIDTGARRPSPTAPGHVLPSRSGTWCRKHRPRLVGGLDVRAVRPHSHRVACVYRTAPRSGQVVAPLPSCQRTPPRGGSPLPFRAVGAPAPASADSSPNSGTCLSTPRPDGDPITPTAPSSAPPCPASRR